MSDNENIFDIVDDAVETADEEEEKEDSGMLFLFPDENTDEEEPDDDGEGISLSFGKVSAQKKEEDLRFLPFLDVKEDTSADDDEPFSSNGDSEFSLSFGKVSAAKKERDYVYMPFLNTDDTSAEEEEKEEEEEPDTGIDIVGGEEDMFTTPLKPRSEEPEPDTETKKPLGGFGSLFAEKERKPQGKKNQRASSQKKKNAQRQPKQSLKPNKVQQIMAAMDPDVLASVSGDPRQMMLLEETVRNELIKQAAHNAVAKELNTDILNDVDVPSQRNRNSQQRQKNGRPPQNQRQRSREQSDGFLSFARQPSRKDSQIPGQSFMNTAETISEFGTESSVKPAPSVQEIPAPQPAATPPAQTMNIPQPTTPPTPIVPPVTPPVTTPPVQHNTTPLTTNISRKSSTLYSAPVPPKKMGMTPGAASAVNPVLATGMAQPKPVITDVSVQNVLKNKRAEVVNKQNDTRSGCVIGVIVGVMLLFVAVISILFGGKVCAEQEKSDTYDRAVALYYEGKYEDCCKELENILDYSKTAALYYNCIYKMAEKKEMAADNTGAIELYERIGEDFENYKTVYTKLRTLKLAVAEKDEQKLKYVQAINGYDDILSKYSDGMKQADIDALREKRNNCCYNYTLILFNKGDYSGAEQYLKELGEANYLDSKDYYDLSLLNEGSTFYKAGQYNMAREKLLPFAESQGTLKFNEYAYALYYLGVSTHNIMLNSDGSEISFEELSKQFDVLERAYGMVKGSTLEESLTSAMKDRIYDRVRLVGSWYINDTRYKDTKFVYAEDGSVTQILKFDLQNGADEFNSRSKVQNGTLTVYGETSTVDLFTEIEFGNLYTSTPDRFTFKNPRTGLTYTMVRSN